MFNSLIMIVLVIVLFLSYWVVLKMRFKVVEKEV